MLEFIKKELLKIGIDTVGALSPDTYTVTRAYKLKKCGFDENDKMSAVIFAIPYYTEHEEKNISSYAIPRDYHLFCRELFSNLLPKLKAEFPEYKFAGFADDSPIDEREAAAKAGLGIIGENGLIITEKYSSYVFFAEIITNYPIEAQEYEIKRCEGCGLCKKACPQSEIGECLSDLTQKKGDLTEKESDIIKKYGCAWGCDLCQESCPHTKKAKIKGTIYTEIEFFKSDLTPILTTDLIHGMSDEEFSARAYSWRKKETILRNLSTMEKQER